MAASFFGGTPQITTGTTWVVAVSAPGAGEQKQILACHVQKNPNTGAVTIQQKKKVGVTDYEVYPEVTLQADQPAQLINGCIVLDATNMTYEIRLTATPGTELKFDVAGFKVP